MINQSTLDFLKELKDNNHKEWFEANRKRYEAAKANLLELSSGLINKIKVWDEPIGAIDPKKSIFRINRDIRFSKDKSPYKTNMGMHFSPGMNEAGYYVHIEPDACFIGGGMWQPEPAKLKSIRQEIDYNLSEFESIVNSDTFKAQFGQLDGSKLSRPPKDYPNDHPGIEWLKHKDFVAGRKFSDQEVTSPDFLDKCAETLKAMYPLRAFLNRAVS